MISSGKPVALVTGSEGFIGKYLVRALTRDGWHVVGVDIKTGGDIRNPLFADSYDYGQVDKVFHLAAQTDARSSSVYADAMANIIGTVNVLEKYRDKVVFASSCAINYPETAYAISKLACEYYCHMYGARIVRLCNIYGSGGHGVFEAFGGADQITIAGTGEQLRTYAHVYDAVTALLYSEKPLHILKGEDLTVNQVAERVAPGKPRVYVPQKKTDLMIGVQVY